MLLVSYAYNEKSFNVAMEVLGPTVFQPKASRNENLSFPVAYIISMHCLAPSLYKKKNSISRSDYFSRFFIVLQRYKINIANTAKI